MKKICKAICLSICVLTLSACSMKDMMVEDRVSPYGLNETVAKIQENAKKVGWVSPAVKNMNKAIAKHGGAPIDGEVRIVELCNADHASNMLQDENNRFVALLMPCAISVYTKSDGKTYVSSMRAGRMGGMMGGRIAEIMDEVDVDQKKILDFLP